MKNIHIIPTDKPSRILFDKEENRLLPLQDSTVFMQYQDLVENQHIYITSDEEIKDVAWILKCKNVNDWNFKSGELKEKDYSYFAVNCVSLALINPEDKKIILTTDTKLIKDGVQSIDDEFIEWFVDNPSCESVIIHTLVHKNHFGFDKHKITYKIIIPKEEPEQFEDEFEMQSRIINKVWDEEESKQEFCDNCNNNICCCIVKKQETFEEAAERRYGTDMDSIRGSSVYDLNTDLKRGFINGAEWQAERSYSEEDIINAIHSVELKDNKNYTKIYAGMKEHLDKLKK